MKAKWLVILMMLTVLAGCDRLAVGAAAATATPEVPVVREEGGSVVVEGNIVPRDFVRIYTRSGGQIAEVLVKKGDLVKKDAVLVRFDDREQVEASLAAARLEQVNAQQALDKLNEKGDVSWSQAHAVLTEANKALVDAQQKLADLDNQTFQDDLDKLKTDVATAKKELDDAQDEWDKYKDLDPASQTRKDQKKKYDDAVKKYDDAVRKRDLKINDLDTAKSAVERAKSAQADAQREADKHAGGGPNKDDLALAQSRLDNAKAQVTAALSALDDLEVKAPYDGTVVELDHVPGETLLPNQQVVLVADLSELYVETNDLTELDVVKISEGQAAIVKPDALPELSLPATVTEIAQSSGKKGGDVTYMVRLKLNEAESRLRWGMTVETRFNED